MLSKFWALLVSSALTAVAFQATATPEGEASTNLDSDNSIIEVDGAGEMPTTNEKDIQFLDAVAESQGLSLQEAEAMYAWQSTMETVASELAESHKDEFAFAIMNPDGEPGATFRFTSAPSAGALQAISQLPVDSLVQTNAPLSASAAESATAEAHETASGVVSDDTAIITSFDGQTDTIEVIVASAVDTDAVEERIRSSFTPETEGSFSTGEAPAIHVIAAPDLKVTPDTIRGGVRVSNASSYCTSGWAVHVKGNNQNRGLITARHCDNDINFYSEGENRRNVLNDASKFLSTDYGDIQYHRSPNEDVGREAYHAVGEYKDVASVQEVAINTALCLFGRSTKGTFDGDPTCTNVRAEGVIVNYENSIGEVHGLVSTDDLVSQGGDSGGPWYSHVSSSLRAAGVHSGRIWGPLVHDRSLFTPIISQGGNNNMDRMDLVIRKD